MSRQLQARPGPLLAASSAIRQHFAGQQHGLGKTTKITPAEQLTGRSIGVQGAVSCLARVRGHEGASLEMLV